MWILLLTTVLNIFLVKSVDPKYGLYLTASVNKTSPIVAGDVLNITFTIWLGRGGTGFIGVNDPKLQIKVSNKAIISAVPTEVSINVVEEESCSASTSIKLVSEEIVTNISIIASTSSAGSSVISAAGSPDIIITDQSNIIISIIKSARVDGLNKWIGWLYFILWSVSFYPQIFLNFHHKSVSGLNLDFVILNVLGFTLYSGYNIGMFFIPEIQEQYQSLDPDGVNPVQINDVVFSVHACLAALLTLLQCLVFDDSDQSQRVSTMCQNYIIFMIIIIITSVSMTIINIINLLSCLNTLSYMKLFITLTKHIPQIITNYRHKSTQGWSIGNIILDASGGLASLVQMILIAYNSDDWSSLIGDVTKLGLSCVSLFFDAVFIIQHFVLYPNAEPYARIH